MDFYGYENSEMKYSIQAPAKLNILLKVLGKRPDGYHNILSVMIPVNLFDDIELRKTDEHNNIDITCDNEKIPKGEDNLIYKAIKLYLKETGFKQGFHILLNKRIPICAGLGGGSSDAGSVLILLNRLFNEPLNQSQLLDISSKIGSDVPFFLYRTPAIVKGRGEVIQPLNRWPSHYYVIVKPPIDIPTGFIYQNLKIKLTNEKKKDNINCLRIDNNFNILDILENDLEAVSISFFPIIEEIKHMLLRAGAKASLMSGSGPSVFGVFDSLNDALLAKQRLISHAVGDVFVVTEIDR